MLLLPLSIGFKRAFFSSFFTGIKLRKVQALGLRRRDPEQFDDGIALLLVTEVATLPGLGSGAAHNRASHLLYPPARPAGNIK